MVHNGIEYGIMAAYAEGLNVLHRANIGHEAARCRPRLAPLEEPRYYQYDIDTSEVAEVWRRGSVIASWLLDLTASALHENPTLDGLAGRVSDSGEGRWTIKAAIDEGVPVPVLSAALYQRFSSRGEAKHADQLLSAMRQQFGGHKSWPRATSSKPEPRTPTTADGMRAPDNIRDMNRVAMTSPVTDDEGKQLDPDPATVEADGHEAEQQADPEVDQRTDERSDERSGHRSDPAPPFYRRLPLLPVIAIAVYLIFTFTGMTTSSLGIASLRSDPNHLNGLKIGRDSRVRSDEWLAQTPLDVGLLATGHLDSTSPLAIRP